MSSKLYRDGRLGKLAEELALKIMVELGYNARMATKEEDYSGKTDIVVKKNGKEHRIQVSLHGKSKRERERLEKRGVYHVALDGSGELFKTREFPLPRITKNIQRQLAEYGL
ncbi:MAG: hypothetical protein J7K72_00795 [Candidatus Aenigmarchaeota archaeon]|nr:hypothetical protein [Candidatus Aenigmarchaeota archaeon]